MTPAPRFPSSEARHLALSRLHTAWLWKHGEPRAVDPEDVLVLAILTGLVDGRYDDIRRLADELETMNGRMRGLESE